MEILLLLLQLGLLGMLWLIRRNPNVSPHLPLLLLFMTLLWFITPVLLTVVFQGYLNAYSFVNYNAFLFYAVLESIALLFSLAFLLVPRPYLRFIVESRLTEIHLTTKGAILGVFISIAVTLLSVVLVAIFIGTSYFDLNAFFYLAEGSETFNNLGSVALLQTFLGCFCCACFIHQWPREQQTFVLWVVLGIWALLTVAAQAPSGARIAMLQPYFLLTLFCQAQPWTTGKKITVAGLGAVGTLLIGSILAVAIGQSRYGDRLKLEDILSSSANATEQNLVTELSLNLLTKFDHFSTGAILVERMGAGAAGVQPYVGAVLAMIPRALLPVKPIPGSFDGTIRGYPTRVVAVQMGMSEEAGNVNVSPTAITIWHLGYLGILVMIVCNALHLYLVNSLLLAPSVFLRALAFFLIGMPALTTLYASPDILLMNLERISLVFLALFLLHHFLRRRMLRQQPWQPAAAYSARSFGAD